jgi:hypothetical protein
MSKSTALILHPLQHEVGGDEADWSLAASLVAMMGNALPPRDPNDDEDEDEDDDEPDEEQEPAVIREPGEDE